MRKEEVGADSGQHDSLPANARPPAEPSPPGAGSPARKLTRFLGQAWYHLYGWACDRLYNEFAWAYDPVSWLVSAGRWADWRRLALAQLPPGRVLEVGFGTGELLFELAASGREVWGLDLSPAMQRITAHKLRARGAAGRAHRVRGLAQALPFADGFFDAVLATFPATYIFDPASLAEFARVLRHAGPDGECSPPARLVIGGLGVTIDDPRLARLALLFYGFPSARGLGYWQEMMSDAGFRPGVMVQPCRGTQVMIIVADRV